MYVKYVAQKPVFKSFRLLKYFQEEFNKLPATNFTTGK